MLSTTSTSAPAGILGRGSAVAPRVAVQGTGVPTTRLRNVIAGVTGTPRGGFTAQFPARNESQKNDGTTLGFHPSRRPQS